MNHSALPLPARRRPAAAAPSLSSVVRHGLAAGGHPLDGATRAALEPRLAQEFSGVRVAPSAPAATRLGAPGDGHERQAERFAAAAGAGPATAPAAAPSAAAGKVDLSAVRVHTDAAAARSVQAMGALAYAAGSHIAFAPGQYTPGTAGGRHVLAHEVAHVAQHAAGADAGGATVRRFTAYTPDEQLADSSLGWKHPSGAPLRVADDGNLVAEDNGWGPGLTKRAWAEPSLIDGSNKLLENASSRARLRPRSGGVNLSGQAPQTGQPAVLTEVEPVKEDGSPVNLASDCGSACRQIMGSGNRDVAVIKGQQKEPSGVAGGIAGGLLGAAALGGGLAAAGYYGGGGVGGAIAGGLIGGAIGAIAGAFAGSALQKKGAPKGTPGEETLSPQDYQGGNPNTPEIWAEEIYKKEFGEGLSRAEAYAAYDALSPDEKDKFDRKYGINKYAAARVGQGMTIVSEKDMPGFTSSGFTWNFHYAAPVLSSGSDYITLESAAGWGPDDWIFFMYGPETKGQSFHEFQGATQTHGSKYTTMVVQPEGK